MSVRANETNNSGIVTVSGGNMPAQNYTTTNPYLSRVTGLPITLTVTANGHAVEVDGDGGFWDTVSGVIVQRTATNADALNA